MTTPPTQLLQMIILFVKMTTLTENDHMSNPIITNLCRALIFNEVCKSENEIFYTKIIGAVYPFPIGPIDAFEGTVQELTRHSQ